MGQDILANGLHKFLFASHMMVGLRLSNAKVIRLAEFCGEVAVRQSG